MLGTVAVLRRYPVKSMLGEDLDAADVTFTGLAGDRRLAVLSRTTGKVASAKFPRLWRDLLILSAAADEEAANGTVRITLPEGKTVLSDDADVDAVLSDLLDQSVTLTATPLPGAALDRAVPEAVLRDGVDVPVPAELMEIGGGGPPSTFVDFAPLHLLTTSTLDRIAELSPHGRADLERYRPNVVIQTTAVGFTENNWLERILRVGDGLVLRVIARTPRCAVPTLAHGALPRDPDAPPDAAALAAWADRNLTPAARPREWYLIDELPRTSVGKVRRFRIALADNTADAEHDQVLSAEEYTCPSLLSRPTFPPRA